MQCLEDSLKVLWMHRVQRVRQGTPEGAPPRAIVISGPTGAGKSDLAITLAQRLGGEIISADSMQVYKHMDVGTAKPSQLQRALIPHHLIDICDVRTPYNACRFAEDAKLAIASAASRNRVPIVVGGTGFYLGALLFGPPQVPPSDPQIRAQLEAHWEKFGPDLAYSYLREQDPVHAAKITKFDKHKILRSLEIIAVTQQKVSAFPWPPKQQRSSVAFQCYFLHRPRFSLYRRIDQRCEIMIRRGLIEETRALVGDGLLENDSARKAIGYQHVLRYFESEQSEGAFRHFRDDFKRASRQYAKRQFTWFRRDPAFRWLDLETLGEEAVGDMVAGEYGSCPG